MLVRVKDAKIKTVMIEVRAMIISDKQVTLSVFRQLKEESVLDHETGELRGVLWGLVNYHFERGCKYHDGTLDPNHVHVVWQKDDELRRDIVKENEHLYFWDGKEGHDWYRAQEFAASAPESYRKYKRADALFRRNIKIIFDLPQLFIAV